MWDERLQVILFEAGEDFEVQNTAYKFIRFVCFDTVANPAGAYYQLGEIEYFGSLSTAVDPNAKSLTKIPISLYATGM